MTSIHQSFEQHGLGNVRKALSGGMTALRFFGMLRGLSVLTLASCLLAAPSFAQTGEMDMNPDGSPPTDTAPPTDKGDCGWGYSVVNNADGSYNVTTTNGNTYHIYQDANGVTHADLLPPDPPDPPLYNVIGGGMVPPAPEKPEPKLYGEKGTGVCGTERTNHEGSPPNFSLPPGYSATFLGYNEYSVSTPSGATYHIYQDANGKTQADLITDQFITTSIANDVADTLKAYQSLKPGESLLVISTTNGMTTRPDGTHVVSVKGHYYTATLGPDGKAAFQPLSGNPFSSSATPNGADASPTPSNGSGSNQPNGPGKTDKTPGTDKQTGFYSPSGESHSSYATVGLPLHFESGVYGGGSVADGHGTPNIIADGAIMFPAGRFYIGPEFGAEYRPSTIVSSIGGPQEGTPTSPTLPISTFANQSLGMTNGLAGVRFAMEMGKFRINVNGGAVLAHLDKRSTMGVCEGNSCSPMNTTNSSKMVPGAYVGVEFERLVTNRIGLIAGYKTEHVSDISVPGLIEQGFGGLRIHLGGGPRS